MAKQTLEGPHGIRIELDSAEIFPDDPGNGTPAMVHVGRENGTYWCALDTGELICGDRGEYNLDSIQMAWLEAQQDAVDSFMEAHSK